MTIKVRPFKTHVEEVSVEGIVDRDSIVCRFYDLVSFRIPAIMVGRDEHGSFATVEETEVEDSDGFVFSIETEFDEIVGGAWGCQITLRRSETTDIALLHNALKKQGIDPGDVNLIVPPRQSVSVYLDKNGKVEGHSRLEPTESRLHILQLVRAAATERILFLPHAVRQMSRPDRMITAAEVRRVIKTGEIIEDYMDDPRGHSCLILGYGEDDRPIHIVCSPKGEFLAIITAYLPDESEWSGGFRVRIK